MTAQSRGGGGTSFPQLGHGEHEKMSGDVVVPQCRVGSHGACMGSARAQREARGAIFKDVRESVARKVARNGTDFRGARSHLHEHTPVTSLIIYSIDGTVFIFIVSVLSVFLLN